MLPVADRYAEGAGRPKQLTLQRGMASGRRHAAEYCSLEEKCTGKDK